MINRHTTVNRGLLIKKAYDSKSCTFDKKKAYDSKSWTFDKKKHTTANRGRLMKKHTRGNRGLLIKKHTTVNRGLLIKSIRQQIVDFR